MEGFLSTVLSLLGLGQRSALASSEKRSEASKLNSEFELMLQKNAEFLRFERTHLHQKISVIPGDTSELYEHVDNAIDLLLSEIDDGLVTAANSRKTILAGSSLVPLSKWDEVISLLYQQKSAAELQSERSKLCISQFHRLLDNDDYDVLIE